MPNIKVNMDGGRRPTTTDDSTVDVNGLAYAVGSRWFYKEAGEEYVCYDATANAAKWVQIAGPRVPWPSQAKMASQINTSASASTCAADILTMQPFTFSNRRQIDRVMVGVTTAGGSGAAMRIGAYAVDPATELPGALLYDSGEFSLTTGSADNGVAVSWEFYPGTVWLASLIKSSSPQATVLRSGGAVLGGIPIPSATLITASTPRYLSASQAYGALPATAPTMAPDSGSNCPVVFLRKA